MTRDQRNRCMSKIRGKDTKVELQLRKAIWNKGLRFRLHARLPGTPDLTFPRSKVALFIDGCFWHGCPIHGVRPKTNRAFWAKKLKENLARDERTNLELKRAGWKVIRCWEHDVEQRLDRVVTKIGRTLNAR
jgi:DNA mismatch endonuclease (patch repair protein)